ncbi:MAG TPA: FtsW/RodA/SpoVE family cell cycle protein [Candidatus Limnocylindrales bacterium]|nr:FtsW/RodA/SpoVE family cell cycle protein [Candidatus Limnocylindrales bacterium]
MRSLRPIARFAELRLLFWVVLLAFLGSVAVRAAAAGDFRADAAALPAALVALALALHLVLVAFGSRGDQLLLPLALALTTVGLVLVQRLAPDRLFVLQLSWLVIAAGAFVATLLVPRDLTALSRYKWTWALLGILLLLSPLFPVIGREINGSRIWIGYGDLFNFQPSEAVKVLLVVFFAAYLEEYREVISSSRRLGPLALPPVPYLVPIVLMWAMAMVVMVMEKDLGATLLFFGIFLAMLYLATGQAVYVLLGFAMFLLGAFAAYELFAHVQARVDTWLDPFAEEARFGPSFQLVQGLFALANGGLLGAGLGGGMPERIPVVWSDFVYAAFTEETGFLGAVALLALYLVFVFRGMTIALRAPTPFLQLLAGGLSFIIALQTLVIVAGNAKLIPLTGVTLPFVSYGGSSLVTNFVIVALLIRVSDITARARGQP